SLLSTFLPCSAPSTLFFNDTATPHISTLSLHDALPISVLDLLGVEVLLREEVLRGVLVERVEVEVVVAEASLPELPRLRPRRVRSEEHTSELQSLTNLVCRLLLEKKKYYKLQTHTTSYL